MSVLFIAVPVALLLACSAAVAFLWAARDGQLDDLETPALRILQEDDLPLERRQAARPPASTRER